MEKEIYDSKDVMTMFEFCDEYNEFCNKSLENEKLEKALKLVKKVEML